MRIYALDTNIISFMLKENPSVTARIHDALAAKCKLVIPSIVYYEVRRGLLLKDTPVLTPAFNRFCRKIPTAPITHDILETAAKIYVALTSTGKPIGDADILIAASCICNGHTLVTDNTQHFERVDELQIVNWAK